MGVQNGVVEGILKSLRNDIPINTDEGSFGSGKSGGLSVVWEPLIDLKRLTTGVSSYTPFDGLSAENFSNMPKQATIPGGERWDLYGLSWYAWTASGVMTELQKAAFNAFILSGSYQIGLNQISIRSVPLVFHFGQKGFNETFLATGTTTTILTASTGPGNDQSYREVWPEETFLTLQSKVQMTFKLSLTTATVAALDGVYFGPCFSRAKASRTP